ncbi:hypothetical protein BDZ45DRAFT_739689 [Acephala macrosclerotiorum]|nr:hypothetical protein BDZ45DRAFT_739689 [Acephala macrosclerotiorum]
MSKRFPTREPETTKPVEQQSPPRPASQKVAPQKKTQSGAKGGSKLALGNVDGAPAPLTASQKPKRQVTNEKADAVTLSSTKVDEERRFSASSGEGDYDLRPTSTKPRSQLLESLAGVLFSEEYPQTQD